MTHSVLLVAFHFAPENASGTHRSLHFARNLLDAGYNVRVLTRVVDEYTPTDPYLSDLFPHSGRVVRVAKPSTLGDHYVCLKKSLKNALRSSRRDRARLQYRSADGAEVGIVETAGGRWSTVMQAIRQQLRAWDTFPDLHRGWYRPAVRAGVRAGREDGIAAVISSGPPWTALLVASKIAKKLGVSLITDFRDPWTSQTGRSGARYDVAWFARLAESKERRILEQSDRVLFNSPGLLRAALRGRQSCDSSRFEVILNGSDAPRRTEERGFPRKESLRVRHFGSLYGGRSIGPVVRALEELIAREMVATDDIVVELFGSTEGSSSDVAVGPNAKAQPEVRLIPTLPYHEAVRRMHEPAVLLVIQPRRFHKQIPTKLYDYIASGNPILVLASEQSAAWEIARGFARCVRADPQDRTAIADILSRMHTRLREGTLRQERTVEDSESLTKEAVGEAFVRIVRETIESHG